MELKKKKSFWKGLNKKTKIKLIVITIVLQAFFIPFFGVLLVYYGPFTNVRDLLVTTAMTTMSHKYIATWFLNEKTINEILEKYKFVVVDENTNLDDVVISEKDKEGIETVEIKEGSFKGKMIIVNDPSRVSLGVASQLGKVGETLSEICKKEGAIGGINAGGFNDVGGTGIGDTPSGIIIKDSKIVWGADIKRLDNSTIIGITTDNKLSFITNPSMSQIQNLNFRDAISFGPGIIVSGKPVFSGNGGYGIQPRAAIGQRKDGAILMLTIDGRGAGGSAGATLGDVRDIFLKHNAYNAVNLDGGSSTTLYLYGKVINNPSDILGERAIPSAFIIK